MKLLMLTRNKIIQAFLKNKDFKDTEWLSVTKKELQNWLDHEKIILRNRFKRK